MQIADMIDGPIRMVTFDLYDTLIEADPPGWQRFHIALRLSGFDVSMEDVMRAYAAGQRFFTSENGRTPIRDRSEDEVLEFRRNLTGVSLETLGIDIDDRTVSEVQGHFLDETQKLGEFGYRPFDDVPDVLQALRKQKLLRGIISNADDDVTRLCLRMGLADFMDIIVTSALVGWEKPDPRTFYAAIEPFNIPASSVLHVGDQPGSDVLGARAVGMAAVLLDRYDQYAGDAGDAVRLTSLTQLPGLVASYNESFR